MEVQIVGFMGIRQAQFEIQGPTLLAGQNMAGKSSILNAVGAVLTRNYKTRGIANEKESGAVIAKGEELASVTVSHNGNSVRMRWPKGELNEQGGDTPQLTNFSAGITRFARTKVEERAKVMTDYLEAHPTIEDFTAELIKIGANADAIKALWSAIEESGWDATHKARREKGTKIKGSWEQLTRENWGSTKAKSWEPKGFTDDLRVVTLEQLTAAIEEKRKAFEAVLQKAAIDGKDLEALRQLASEEEARNTAVAEAKADGEAKAALVDEAKEAIQKLERLIEPTQPCPHCAKPVKIGAGNQIVKPNKPMSEEDAKLNADKLYQWKDAKIERENDLAEARQTYSVAQKEWLDAHTAGARVKAIEAAGGDNGEGTNESHVQAAREEKDLAVARRDLFKAWEEARQLYRGWAINEQAVEILAPEGLRKTVLIQKLGGVNLELAQVCTAFKQQPVEIRDDLTVWMNGHPYAMLSESEQWRCDLALQIVLSRIEKAPLILVDRADVLNREWKSKIFAGLLAMKIRALVAIAANDPTGIPELAPHGGTSLWVGDGTVVSREAAVAVMKKAS